MITKSEFMELGGDNLGAALALGEMTRGSDKKKYFGQLIIPKLQELEIRGEHFYLLFKDVCQQDLGLMAYLCIQCSDEVLKDISSRQDLTGRQVVGIYIAKFEKLKQIQSK